MNRRILTAVAAFAFLTASACGGDASDDSASTQTFELQGGTFALSQVMENGGDDCHLAAALSDPDRRIAVTRDGDALTFNLNDDPSANDETMAHATLDGNQLVSPVRALYVTDADASGCTLLVDETVSVHLTADDTLELRLDVVYADASDDPGACTPEHVGTLRMPCDSSFTFKATRTE